MIKTSVVIVYYNNISNLKNTIDSVLETTNKSEVEVIVVNNSDDVIKNELSQKRLEQIRYLNPTSNLGYGGGNNLGIDTSKGEYIFILNPDVVIEPSTIGKLSNFLDKNKKAAIAAPVLIDSLGRRYKQIGKSELTPMVAIFSLSIISRIFPNNPIARDYWGSSKEEDVYERVFVVPGSAFMIRKKAIVDIGLFDEKIFLFFEESDIGRRLNEMGWESYMLTNVKVAHKWSTKNRDDLKPHFLRSRRYYFKKHYNPVSALITEMILRINKFHIIIFVIIVILLIFIEYLNWI